MGENKIEFWNGLIKVDFDERLQIANKTFNRTIISFIKTVGLAIAINLCPYSSIRWLLAAVSIYYAIKAVGNAAWLIIYLRLKRKHQK